VHSSGYIDRFLSEEEEQEAVEIGELESIVLILFCDLRAILFEQHGLTLDSPSSGPTLPCRGNEAAVLDAERRQ
jgi:hypothetical protein